MTPDIATLGLRVDARQINDADRSLQNFQRSGDRAERSADRLSGTMARMARMAASIGAALAANVIIKQADAWANMQGKLSLVTNSTRELASVNDKLFAVAQRTRSELEATAGLYANLTRSTRELGTSEAQRIRITETINKAMAVSGASADSAAGAIRQLGQAFGSGVLRGDEFNSVLEASPRLIEAIAAGMGRTTGEMRALAEQGKLTSSAIMQGLLSQSKAIDAEFARMPTTVGQAMTQVQNALLRTIGVFDQQNKLSGSLASTLTGLANNMGTVTSAVMTLAAVGLTKWLSTVVERTYAAVTASRAHAAATLATATAEAQGTAQASLLANARLAEVRAATLAATGNVQLALTTNALIPAEARATLAANAHSAAMLGLSAAQRGVAVTSGLVAGALALTGGPLGLLVLGLGIAATAWSWYKSKQEDANAKAAEDTEKSTGEIIEDLNRQNAKLRERIELAKQAGMAPIAQAGGEAAQRLAEINKLLQAEKALAAQGKGDALQLINLQAIYDELARSVGTVAASTNELANAQKGSNVDAWLDKNSQYLTQSEKLAAALKKAKEELKVDVLPADIEKRIRDSFGKKDVKDMQAAIDSAKDYAKSLREQREEIGLTENASILLNASRAASVAPSTKLADAIMAEARALVVARAESEDALKAKAQYDEAVKAQADARLQETLAAQAAVDKTREEVETYGMGAEALTRYSIAKLTAYRDGLMIAGAWGSEIEHLDNLIAKQQELLGLQGQRDVLDNMFDTAKVESFGDALRDAFGAAGDSLGELTNSLQSYLDKQNAADKDRAKAKLKYAGDDKKIAAEIGKIDAKQEKDRIAAYADMAGAAKGFFKEKTVGYKLLEAAERGFRTYELAMNTATMFSKLAATSTTTAAAVAGNAALATSSTVAAGTVVAANTAIGTSAAAAGVATQAMGDPYTAFARIAAMIAVMASIGFAVAGGGKTSPSTSSAEYVQKNQGAGSVFGDASAKSATISKSIDLLEENSSMLLPLTEGMLAALRSIDAAMNGLTNIVLRTPGVVDGSNMGIQTGKTGAGLGSQLAGGALGAGVGYMAGAGFSAFTALGAVGGPLGMIAGAVVGAIVGKLWGSTKQNITDSGIQFGGRVGDLQNGQGFNQYANVHTTKKSWFGLSKKESDALQTGALDGEVTQQLGLVFKNLETVLRSAATGLGMSADDVGTAVQNATVDLTKLSLNGLKGQELQDAVNAVLSKATDDVAAAALPGFDAYRKLGEGYAETVIRVASGIEQAGLELELLGVAAIGYTEIANRQGDVGAEIVRQSIVAREGLSGVGQIMGTLGGSASELAETYRDLLAAQESMSLVGMDPSKLDVGMIRQAGGLDKLQSGLDNYFESFFSDSEKLAAKTAAMGEKFAALGVAMPATGAGFRDLVESTPALAARLLLLSEGFGELMEMTDSNAAADLELMNTRRGMEAQIMRLQGDEAGALAVERQLELAGMDASLRPLQQRAWGLEDEKKATEAAAKAAEKARNDAMSALRRAVDAERAVKQKAHEATIKGLDAAMTESRNKISTLSNLSGVLNGAREQVGVEDTDRGAAQAQLQAALAIARAGGALAVDAEQVKRALGVLSKDSADDFGSSREYLVDRYQTAIALGELAAITDEALTFEDKNLAKLEDMRKLAEDSYAADMKFYDEMLADAQRRLDQANGLDVSVKSVADALAAFNKTLAPAATGAVQAAPSGAAAGTGAQADPLEALYKSVLGRASDAAGKAFWAERMANGATIESVATAMRGSDEGRAGGWSTGSMSASSATIARPDGENRDLVAEIKSLKTELVDALGVVASYTQRTATTNEDMNRRELEKEDVA